MLPLPRFLLFEHRASETIHEIYRVDRKFPSSRTQRARFLTRRKMNSSKRQACSSPDVDLKPILIMNDSGGRAESPLIRTDNDADDYPIPILPSPGFNVTENQTAQGREAISKQKSYPASGVNVSVKETDSEGNSMGVLYQSTIGSINGDQKDNRRNGDFFFPFLLRRAWVAPEQSSHQRHECGHFRSMYTRFLSVSTSDGYAVSGPRPRRVQFIRRTL